MEPKPKASASLIAGVILVILGLLSLTPWSMFGFNFWSTFWPFIIIGVGLLFFAGMVAGGKSLSGLAIPGSIITTVGVILFVQNQTNRWESWSYAWTLIVMAVGLGMYIAGQYGGSEGQRQAGLRTLQLGLVMFFIFGAFFSMIFNYFGLSKVAFPAALILLGIYLLVTRMGILRAAPGEHRVSDSKVEG